MIKWKGGKKIPAELRRKRVAATEKQGRDTVPNAEKVFLSERYLSRIGVCSLLNVGMPRNAETHDTRELLRTNRAWRPAGQTITHLLLAIVFRSYGSERACNVCQNTAFRCHWPHGPVSPSTRILQPSSFSLKPTVCYFGGCVPNEREEFTRFELPAPYLCLTRRPMGFRRSGWHPSASYHTAVLWWQ